MTEAIENYENICFKCLKEKQIETFSLYRSNYGSSFDNNYTTLQICEDCKPRDLGEWFNEEPEYNGHSENYKYEKNIIEFVKTFSIEGQELFWNRLAYGANADEMESQDWIDMKLGILPDEKYEEYGYYSPSKIKAYKERFPTCEHPVNRIWDDNSKGCWCPFGASGNYGQKAGWNISDECYECEYYKLRETPIKDINSEDFDDYKMYIKSKMNFDKWDKKFGNM